MKPMKTAKVLARLDKAGCTMLRTSGRHTVYRCPCGEHTAPVPDSHREISAGVVRSLINQMPCLPEGWLQ